MTKKMGLGRGISALISGTSADGPTDAPAKDQGSVMAGFDADQSDNAEAIRQLPIKDIHPGTHQARTNFNPESLQELADSIRANGVLVPIMVRQSERGFELIAGERRWRAAQAAGLEKIPAILRNEDDKTVSEISLIENIQREDLNPVEEARAYCDLLERFGYTKERMSQRLGKSRTSISNSLRLLQLPDTIQADVGAGRLSAGHARALLVLQDERLQLTLRDRIIERGHSVREVELLVERIMTEPPSEDNKPVKTKLSVVKSSFPYPYVIEQLTQKLATKVKGKGNENKGIIEIHYFSNEELTRIIEQIDG